MKAPNNNHGLSAPYTIVVGVTGHRFLHQLDLLIPRIDAVFEFVEAEWPGAELTVISALAEGSDRLVVERALCRYRARLVVPLPLPESLYLQDFQSSDSRQEFEELLARADEIIRFPIAETRPDGYAVAGHYMLEHCDLLIALWDGQPAQGDGGTGAVVDAARKRRMPLIWIYTHNYRPNLNPTLLSIQQGAVVFENFEM